MTEADVATCPKHMTFGPCGGVRDDGSCEMRAHPCPFALTAEPVAWTDPPRSEPPPSSGLLAALATGRAVITDLSLPPYDAEAVAAMTRLLADSCDAFLVGEHQSRPDFPPVLMAQLIRGAGGVPWLTLACRDRNRVVLEQEVTGLRLAGVDGVLCVTGDGRAPGVRDGVTQVFDLDGTELAALAAAAGLAVAVPESPDAFPRELRPGRLVEKQRAGAHVAFLNHVGSPARVATYVARARDLGLTIPVVAGVAVYTDERSARVLQSFPGLQLDDARVERVLAAPDTRAAGIEAAVEEARALLAIDGVAGVDLSGRGSSRGEFHEAEVKAEIGYRLRDAS
ncbi:methylenetetrahydrofolate reductase C-terminal domain-containing protein [Nocardioides plantarum]|uniref:Methylenetetrahydrofolate reductase C-terminal domain-containing protein n=1 Tax=Nocardioides plantarum TaxID=29299 RepID=A0ABV5KFN8_9ACTN|nr:methylenetetrahydrofolate reductase C-terminal domain-containing protein [Nocardioides plantarum]